MEKHKLTNGHNNDCNCYLCQAEKEFMESYKRDINKLIDMGRSKNNTYPIIAFEIYIDINNKDIIKCCE